MTKASLSDFRFLMSFYTFRRNVFGIFRIKFWSSLSILTTTRFLEPILINSPVRPTREPLTTSTLSPGANFSEETSISASLLISNRRLSIWFWGIETGCPSKETNFTTPRILYTTGKFLLLVFTKIYEGRRGFSTSFLRSLQILYVLWRGRKVTILSSTSRWYTSFSALGRV